jgi:thiol-disulfide isomerase/thioredoxin
MKKGVLNQKILTTWKAVRSWLLFAGVLILLRYTGILAGVSVVTSSALMDMGLMQATPSVPPNEEYLDYNFTMRDLDGKKISFNTMKGKTIFLNLWATWCGPCRAEMPSIQKLYEQTDREKIVFVMLSVDDNNYPKKVSKFVASSEYTFPVYVAETLPAVLNVPSIPTTFVISSDGKIIYKKVGMANYNSEEFKKFLKDQAK